MTTDALDTKPTALDYVGALAVKNDRKFVDSDIDNVLRLAAVRYLAAYRGDFDYLVDMQATYARYTRLSDGQVRGVLNCMRAEYLRSNAPADADADPVTDVGLYRNPNNGTIYKVQKAKTTGNLYAKKLVLVDRYGDKPKVTFEYAPGLRFLKAAWKMTLDEAEAFGALYGQCVRCGRTLTVKESVAASMGPVCRKYFA